MPIQPSKHRRGFTLTEMLVVIGIIALVASITLVVLGKARRSANQSQLAFQLQTMAVGLDAYQTLFQSYPITSIDATGTADDEINRVGLRGARLLCKALMGPQGVPTPAPGVGTAYNPAKIGGVDGKVGLGFAVPGRSGIAVTGDDEGNLKGQTHGPFLAPDKFKIANSASVRETTGGIDYEIGDPLPGKNYDDRAVLLDANDNPILYFPVLNAQSPVQLEYAYLSRGTKTRKPAWQTRQEENTGPAEPALGTFAGTPMYNGTDNEAWLPADVLRERLGDANKNGRIDAGETPAVRGKYILWSPGPDGIYGRNVQASATEKAKRENDDVTNFQGQ